MGQTFYYPDAAAGEFFYLILPLVFQRSRANDQYFRNSVSTLQKFGHTQSLQGFTESHVIGQQAAAGDRCKPYALFLIGIKLCTQQLVKRRIVIASESIVDSLFSFLPVSVFQYKFKGIRIAPERGRYFCPSLLI